MSTFNTKPRRTRKGVDANASLFGRAILERQTSLHISQIGKNTAQTLERSIRAQNEGKCIVDGFVRENSVKIISYSAGRAFGDAITFSVVFECQICSPVEGMVIQCIATNITKAGIRAESVESPSPVVVFVTRDHNYDNDAFSTVRENDEISVKVIGQRFELNDPRISVVAKLATSSSNTGDGARGNSRLSSPKGAMRPQPRISIENK